MKLTKADKEIIKEFGYEDKDFDQIERAIGKTKYSLSMVGNGVEKISAKKAMEILGRRNFLSGICRSAFHWSSVRTPDDYSCKVFFDSSRLFRE